MIQFFKKFQDGIGFTGFGNTVGDLQLQQQLKVELMVSSRWCY